MVGIVRFFFLVALGLGVFSWSKMEKKNEQIETQVKWLGEEAQVLIAVWVE